MAATQGTPVERIVGDPQVMLLNPNQQTVQRLDTVGRIEQLRFRLSGTLTLASYTTAPQKYVEALENLIAALTVTGTAARQGAVTATLTNASGTFLRHKTHLMEGTDVNRTDVGTTNAAFAFNTAFKKYFIDPRSDMRNLTALEASLLSQLSLAVQWRDVTAMVTGGVAGTATLSNVQMITHAVMVLGAQPAARPFVKESQRPFNITVSQNDAVYPNVPIGTILRRQWLQAFVGATSFADPSDAIYGATNKAEGPHVRLRANRVLDYFDKVYPVLKDDNKELYGVEVMPVGLAVLETSRSAKLRGSLNTSGMQRLDNIIDTSYQAGNTNTLTITDEEIVGLTQ